MATEAKKVAVSAPVRVSPYHAARLEHDRRFGDLNNHNRFLRGALLLSLAVNVFTGWKNVELASASQVVPYIVEVDRLGQMTAFGEVGTWADPAQRQISAEIVRVINGLRTVYADPIAQGDATREGYGRVRGDARKFIDGYFSDPALNPWVLSENIVRQVDVSSVRRYPGTDRWAVEWVEREIPIRGGSARVRNWKAEITTKVIPPRSREELMANFSGVYITGLDWQATTEPRELSEAEIQRALEHSTARRARGVTLEAPVLNPVRPGTPSAQPVAPASTPAVQTP